MARRIGWGIAVSVLLLGMTVLAGCQRNNNGAHKDIRALWGGILAPQQMKDLWNFHRAHKDRFPGSSGERPDLYKIWKELDLSQEQQGQLLKTAGELVDRAHPSLMAAIETGNELKKKVLEGDPNHPAIGPLSTRLGEEIGEISWDLALARRQMRSALTPEQIGILERLRSKHELRRKEVIEALPGMAEDLAVLWDRLQVTPQQAEALGAAHRLALSYRQNQYAKHREEWRAELAKILTAEQMAIADRFREKHIARGETHFMKTAAERERFQNELGLAGEQKIKLVQFVLDRRSRIVPAVQEVMIAARGLREQVHADIPDRNHLKAAAARLGEAIHQAARLGAGLLAEAGEVLTKEQLDLFKGHIASRGDQHLEFARTIPAEFHELNDFLNKLALSPGQKDEVVKLISEKHKTLRTQRAGWTCRF